MKDQTKILLKLLEKGKSCNEICDTLHISNRQLYNNLTNIKNKGFLFSRKYTSNGDILYQTTNFIPEENLTNSIKLDDTYMKVLVISDLHFGNSDERLDRVKRVFDYCAKNNIHIIFCCGDFLDGTFSRGLQNIYKFYEQVDYFIKNYPFDKNILTFGVGGDHDLSGITDCGQNFLEAIYNYRHDCIIPGFSNAIVNIKDTNILLHHHTQKGKVVENMNIYFFGHSHKYDSVMEKNGQIKIKVPSLSDINVQPFNVLPTALETEFIYEKGDLHLLRLKQIYFGDKDYILNQIGYEFPINKNKKNDDEIRSQEDKMVKKLNKTK